MRLLLFILCLFLQPTAVAQVLYIRSTDLTVESVAWGYDPDAPSMPAECYAPVTVMVSSCGESVQGLLTLEYPQDASQNASIVAPFATTPNARTPVELLACLPRNCQWVKLTLADSEGNVERMEFNGAIGQDAMPTITADHCRIALLGAVQATEVPPTLAQGMPSQAWQYTGTPNGNQVSEPWWQTATTQRVPVLPDAWIAYEAFDVAIAREQDVLQAPSSAREALHTWVRAGGRLVLIANQAGPRIFEAAPDGTAGMVTIDEPLELTPGASTKVAFAVSRPGVSSTSPAPATLDPAKSVVRLLRLTPVGRAAGWSVRYGVVEPPSSTDAECGLVARGPVGLGFVSIVGMNTSKVCGIDSASHDSLWREIVRPMLPHWSTSTNPQNSWWGSGSSGPDYATSTAIASTLDSITTTPSIGGGFFIVTMVAVAVLGLLIGPVGRIVLKRKRWLSINWLAALVCIAVVSLAGLLIPKLLRSGETAVARWSAVDAICDERGAIRDAWSTSLTCLFAGRPGITPLPESEGNDALPGGAWWRGISTVTDYNPSGSRSPALTLVTVPGGAAQRAGLLVQPVEFGQWTYRAFLDQRAAGPDALQNITLSLAKEDDRCLLIVRGLGGATITSAAVLLPHGKIELTPVSDPDQAQLKDSGIVRLRGEVVSPRSDAEEVPVRHVGWTPPGQSDEQAQAMALTSSLPMQRNRGVAIESHISQGDLCVRLQLSQVPLAWKSGGWEPSATRHDVLLHAILPQSSVKNEVP